MSDQITLTAELRHEFGKGAARRLRRDHKVPAVMYGHGAEPVHIALPGHDTLLALRAANALLSIDIEGRSQLALPKQVQRDPVKGNIEHVDLIVVRRGEKVVVDVRVILAGEAAAETMVVLDTQTVALEVEATRIPERLEVSIEGLEAGTQILARELKLPEGATFHGDEDTLVVNITQQVTQEALDAGLSGDAGAAFDDEAGETASDEG